MTANFNPINAKQAFLITTQVFPKDDPEKLNMIITQKYNDTANAVNVREIALYDEAEVVTGQQFFTQGDNQKKRQTYRKVFNLGVIAPGATSSVAHNITGGTPLFTRIYGTVVTDIVDQRPIPYASATLVTNQIEVKATATNYIVINGATAPNVTSGILVLEYIKQ